MAMRDLDYQARVLTAVDDYLALLVSEKERAEKIASVATAQPELGLEVPDFAANAWEEFRSAGKLPVSRAGIPYSPRRDGVGRCVPNLVLKVPTGGGKTYLATSVVSRIFGRYLTRNTGFVLWLVPNEAIYSQTWRQLTDRQHPYRQVLDKVGAGRVRILQKSDSLDAMDVRDNLCVLLLMLQSANRKNPDPLKIFRDRGDVRGFFPPEGAQDAHRRLVQEIPNLETYDESPQDGSFWPLVKDSLGNALRLIRPVIVLDEGHRAVSQLSHDTIYGLNPCFSLELTATPKDVAAVGGRNPRPARFANVLVEVRGTELEREGMIKMPLNLDPRQGTDWRATLRAALERLDNLDRDAKKLYAEKGRYIRPIMLVQAERTGDDQVDGQHIHAKDVVEWLKRAGLNDTEIAVKTATTNDLAEPENQDLLAPTNGIRVIITKDALREGWDCPFAYVLCSLAANRNLSAMTQLVGRILRQPHAEKIGDSPLDECYVFTHHADTAEAVEAIRSGLEEDGLGDLVKEIRTQTPDGGNGGPRVIERRDQFRGLEIFLPIVLKRDGVNLRSLDYETDILYPLDWNELDVSPFVASIPENAQTVDHQLRRIRLTDQGGDHIIAEGTGATMERLEIDPPYMVRMISDLVPNPWTARGIVGAILDGLVARGFSRERLAEIGGFVLDELRKWLESQRTVKAELAFRAQVACGAIQFRLRADGRNWRLPLQTITYAPEGARQLVNKQGGALERSLFSPIYEADFSNPDEREVAVYMDGELALKWWHRNVAKSQYALQGWKREKIYPDFIFAVSRADSSTRMVVVEMKGEFLSGNQDTEYKRELLAILSEAFVWDTAVPAGTLEIVEDAGTTVHCELVLLTEWQKRLASLTAAS